VVKTKSRFWIKLHPERTSLDPRIDRFRWYVDLMFGKRQLTTGQCLVSRLRYGAALALADKFSRELGNIQIRQPDEPKRNK